MDEVLYRNIELHKDTLYFLYVGEIKAFYLNEFLRDGLERIYKKKFDFIAIVPDVMETYPEGNLMVINPIAREARVLEGKNVSCRLPGRQFAGMVSQHVEVVELVNRLLDRQDELLVSVFHSLPEMALDRFPGVRILGPDSHLANAWNSKLNMYRSLADRIPLPPFKMCFNRSELLETARPLWNEWSDGIFVSLEYSAAGAFSFMAHCEEELLDQLGDWEPPYLISRFIPHDYDPTVLGVVANDDDVYIGLIADQQMVDVNKFRGSVFPSVLPPETLDILTELTRRVGREMGKTGYRGIFGCDYILDKNGDVYFVEVNARKQGTTMEMCCTLENSLPAGCPNLMELEYSALTRHRFPINTVELDGNPKNIHWGTYNLKVDQDVQTRKSLPQPEHERAVFRKVVDDDVSAEHIVVEHVGSPFLVKAGTFLGRVIAVAKDYKDVYKGLESGKKTLLETLGEG